MLFDGLEAQCPVRASAGEEDTDSVIPLVRGEREEELIDEGAARFLQRGDTQSPALEGEGRRWAGSGRHGRARSARRPRPAARASRCAWRGSRPSSSGARAGGAARPPAQGARRGTLSKNRSSASSPPADAPMPTTRYGSLPPEDGGVMSVRSVSAMVRSAPTGAQLYVKGTVRRWCGRCKRALRPLNAARNSHAMPGGERSRARHLRRGGLLIGLSASRRSSRPRPGDIRSDKPGDSAAPPPRPPRFCPCAGARGCSGTQSPRRARRRDEPWRNQRAGEPQRVIAALEQVNCVGEIRRSGIDLGRLGRGRRRRDRLARVRLRGGGRDGLQSHPRCRRRAGRLYRCAAQARCRGGSGGGGGGRCGGRRIDRGDGRAPRAAGGEFRRRRRRSGPRPCLPAR